MSINTVGEGSFDAVIARSPEPVKEIARALRALVAEVRPGVTEVPWPVQGNAGYGVGPKKMSEQFCYIMPLSKHANLGFYYGADLPDPEGLLEGAGKSLRHVKVRSLDEARRPALRRLVAAASKHLPKLKIGAR